MTSSNANRRAWEPTMMLAPNLEEIFLNKWVELTSQHKKTHADVRKLICVCVCVRVCVCMCVCACVCHCVCVHYVYNLYMQYTIHCRVFTDFPTLFSNVTFSPWWSLTWAKESNCSAALSPLTVLFAKYMSPRSSTNEPMICKEGEYHYSQYLVTMAKITLNAEP